MRLRAFLAGVAAAVSVVAAPAAFSAEPGKGAPAPAARTGDPIPAISDMAMGRLLLKAGKVEDARAFLEQAQPENPDERIERLFLLGRIEMRLGRAREAARRFEEVLAQRPGLTRVRLELAQAYFAAGRDDAARRHFEAALADRPPSSVENAVEDFLSHIDARKRWSASASVALLPETNPVKRTDREEVRIGGAPFKLNEDARAASGVGALASAGASFSPVIAEDWRGVLAASAAGKFYRERAWNDVSVRAEAGLARLFDWGVVSGGARAGRQWLGGEAYSRSAGPWVRGRARLSSTLRLKAAASAERLVHDGLPDRDGWRLSAAPGLTWALDGRTSIEATLDLEAVTAREDRHASRLAGIGATVSRAFEGGLSLAPSLSADIRRHSGRDPLFDRTRTDRTVRASLRALHRGLRYEGFAPYVGYSFEWRDSNIPIHSYRNHGAILGVRRAF